MMTIAMGAFCAGGLIVAADTNVVMSDGTKTSGRKVTSTKSEYGSFVIANASDDGNAASALMSQLEKEFRYNEITCLARLEELCADRMTTWASAHQKPPSVQFIVGAFINGGDPPILGGLNVGGYGLYFCEPPNTVRQISEFDDEHGYLAIGSGASITEPIYKSLFASMASPAVRLKQFSYLMYRAKKGSALCGGYTNAVILRAHNEPLWVMPLDMAIAEDTGRSLDFIFSMTATAMMSVGDETIEDFSKNLAEMVVSAGRKYRSLKFHSLDSGEIE